MGLDYYPLQVGNYAIYHVDETNIVQSVETSASYELKLTVADSSINEQGRVTYFISREKRANTTDDWKSIDMWSANEINNTIVQNEGNVLFVKLIFPPSRNLEWNGNQYNSKDTEPYYISELDESITLSSGFETDHSLTVVQSDLLDNVVETDQRKEVYAKDVGLIYKEVTQLQYCTSPNCLGQQKVDKGYILIQSLKEYGKM